MNTPPATSDLDPRDIAQAMTDHWHMRVDRMTYAPLGFGSHHWLVNISGSTPQSLFVTADRKASGSGPEVELRSALTAAWHLRHQAGIEAVVAPLPTVDGEILVPVNAQWVVALYPYVSVKKSEWGAFASDKDRHRAQQLVARIHAVDPSSLPLQSLQREDFAIPYRSELFARLNALTGVWEAGPYAERTRVLLERSADRIRAGFDRYDALVDDSKDAAGDWVITHGEPHAGNIIRRADGHDMVVVDWDTCAIAPRERDLWQLFPADDHTVAGIAAYLEAAGLPDAAVSPDRLALYRLRWDLAEIAIYADGFFNEHQDSEDSRIGWGGLESSIEKLEHHLR